MNAPPRPGGNGGEGEPAATPPETLRSARRTDLRTLVAVIGPLLFSPSLLLLADRPWRVAEVPALLIYVFAVWLVGIVLTYLLAGRSP